jgi:hypothetical protein
VGENHFSVKMPLRRAQTGKPLADADAVYFPMEDVDTGKPVVCKVAYEYLQKRERVPEDATSGEMLWAFQVLRDDIEAVVSSL